MMIVIKSVSESVLFAEIIILVRITISLVICLVSMIGLDMKDA